MKKAHLKTEDVKVKVQGLYVSVMKAERLKLSTFLWRNRLTSVFDNNHHLSVLLSCFLYYNLFLAV